MISYKSRLLKSLNDLVKAVTGKASKKEDVPSIIEDLAKNYSGLSSITVTNIQALTTAQCNALSCGDTVIKVTGNQKHRYVVSYKEDAKGMCLTYTDCENVETVAYDCTEGTWSYTSTDVTHIAQ